MNSKRPPIQPSLNLKIKTEEGALTAVLFAFRAPFIFNFNSKSLRSRSFLNGAAAGIYAV